MGYRLQMSEEIYDWLADLRDSDPPAAALVVQALATLAGTGGYLGLPLVALVGGQLQPDELPSALEWRYHAWLQSLTRLRLQVAAAATRRKDLERQLAEQEPETLRKDLERLLAEPEPEPEQVTGLRERLAAAIEEEQRLIETCHQEQLQADTFRARKEVLKASLAVTRVEQLLDPSGAAARFDELTSMIEPDLDLEPPAEGLLELRPGAPADSGIRILFAVEPPGTALLIAVLEGADAIRDHHREAVDLASEALRDVRSGQAPEATAHTFADAQSLLAELLP
ncbi:MAG TPA: hypothetical protein VFV73_40245 [Streptosporangiaceae bacterium]|nr:hypothetical protein [Streptosporangiaceae bacterium]